MCYKKFPLTLFDEGAPADGGEASDAGTVEEASAQDVSGGMDAETTDGAPDQTQRELTDEEKEQAFHDFINKPENKPFYQKAVNDILGRRFKEEKRSEKRLDEITDKFSVLMARYDVDNLSDLAEALEADNLYESEAYDRNMDVDDYKAFMKLKAENEIKARENSRKEAEIAMAERRKAAEEKYTGWIKEADELKKAYPDFDLRTEIANDDFAEDLRRGKSVKDAYERAHIADIIKARSTESAQAVADNIRAKGARPKENGLSTSHAVYEDIDVSKLTDEQFDEIFDRVAKGEKISFKRRE